MQPDQTLTRRQRLRHTVRWRQLGISAGGAMLIGLYSPNWWVTFLACLGWGMAVSAVGSKLDRWNAELREGWREEWRPE